MSQRQRLDLRIGTEQGHLLGDGNEKDQLVRNLLGRLIGQGVGDLDALKKGPDAIGKGQLFCLGQFALVLHGDVGIAPQKQHQVLQDFDGFLGDLDGFCVVYHGERAFVDQELQQRFGRAGLALVGDDQFGVGNHLLRKREVGRRKRGLP